MNLGFGCITDLLGWSSKGLKSSVKIRTHYKLQEVAI